MISQVIIMALFTLQYGVEELEAYVIIFIIFLLWTVISAKVKSRMFSNEIFTEMSLY